MPQTLTFAKVFTAEGEKNGKPWKRWDFKTEDGQRYVTFNAGLANRISVNTPVTVEIEGDSKIASLIASEPAGNQQEGNQSQNSSQAVRTAPVAAQGHSGRDFKAEAEGKTRCALVSALLPALFTAQVAKGGEPSPENARVLLEWAFKYVFQADEIPF